MTETRSLVYYGEFDSCENDPEVQRESERERERRAARASRRNLIPPKYWRQRLELFSRYEEGIKVGKADWKTITPENIANDVACRFSGMKTVLDFYCGIGGHSIQLALNKGTKVISVDDCSQRLEHAIHNARIYGVEKSITFVKKNVLEVAAEYVEGEKKDKEIDGIFMRPPCNHEEEEGGDDYSREGLCFDVSRFNRIVELARQITPNICIIAPKSIHPMNVYNNFGPCQIEIENNYYRGQVKNRSIYFGKLIKPWEDDDPDVEVYKVAPSSDINHPPTSSTHSTAQSNGSNRDDSSDDAESPRYVGLYGSFRHLWQRESEDQY